jgi:hypothetical protein
MRLWFPVRQDIFPAWCLGNLFVRNCISSENWTVVGLFEAQTGEFRCTFPQNREPRRRDGFADDYLHRHKTINYR